MSEICANLYVFLGTSTASFVCLFCELLSVVISSECWVE